MNSTFARSAGALGAGLLALTLVGAGSTAAQAHGKGKVVRSSGSCSAAADWKLKAKADDGRLEVELEVDSNKPGQKWSVRMTDNGHRFFAGHRTTSGPSGSFSIERRPANRGGSDRIKGVATNPKSGERCVGVVVF